jgi:hypothetical protein
MTGTNRHRSKFWILVAFVLILVLFTTPAIAGKEIANLEFLNFIFTKLTEDGIDHIYRRCGG